MIQNKTKVIGLTGGISTGKSTVSEILTRKGFKVIDADLISREILDIGQDAYKEVVDFFGLEVLNPDKTINRTYLGTKIFRDKKLRDRLNSITHPSIMKKIKQQVDLNHEEEIIFLDIPLLIEVYDELVSAEIYFDEIWLVYCDRETQIKRLMKRDSISHDQAELKINAQMDMENKRKLVDRIIDNTKDLDYLIDQIKTALEQIF